MTAFASASGTFSWGSATWEIRSVNHRYLETWFRLPDTVRDIEMPLRELIRKKLHRGKLDSTLQLKLSPDLHQLSVNLELARQYIDAAGKIAALLPDGRTPSPMEILTAPGVLEQPQQDASAIQSDLVELYQSGLDKLQADRAREGKQLAGLLTERLDALDRQAQVVKQAVPQIIAAQQDKLRERLAELNSAINQDRLEQELVFIAQKADVDEELDRLLTHSEEIRKTLEQQGPVGRRLDFLMQELNREANTLGSKSIATISSQTSVELKVLIEQMREQIQNIE